MAAPLAWLIDTNVVPEMMRPEQRLAAFLDTIATRTPAFHPSPVGRMLDGIGRLTPGQRWRSLAEWFRDLLDDLFEDRVVPWSASDAQACARTDHGGQTPAR